MSNIPHDAPTIRTTVQNREDKIHVIVGSDAICDVQIKDPSISAQHIKVTLIKRGLFHVTDLGSDLGTFCKGQQITDAAVSIHDSIQLGRHPVSMFSIAPHLTTKKQAQQKKSGTLLLTNKSIVIGSAPTCDFVIYDPNVASRHIDVRMGGEVFLIKNSMPDNTTFLNGKAIGSGWTPINHNDELHLGSFPLPKKIYLDWHTRLDAEQDILEERNFTIKPGENGTFYIGRDPDCSIHINSTRVSWQHAKLIVADNVATLYDLSSSNGCFVDGQRIRQAVITQKSQVSIGGIQLYLFGKQQRITDQIRIDAHNITRTLPSGKTLLHNISLSIHPGELVALMGPSGAGKTTLLEILTGQKAPTSGNVFVNGQDLHKNWGEFRDRIGYVPQEDIMHRDITVYEVLYYAAKLKLPTDLPDEDIKNIVENLLTKMGLAHIRNSIIGGEKERGVSGGQRKKVNIALELLTEPNLLFLDEPTSGLDSSSTLDVMQVLRDLTDSGTTIIMTIHQPRIEAYQLLTHLILLTKGGRLAYFGTSNATSYFEHVTKSKKDPQANPADFMIDLLESVAVKRSPEVWEQDYRNSNLFTLYVEQRIQKPIDVPPALGMVKRSFLGQFTTLFLRYTKRKMNDKASMFIQLIQAPIIAISLAILFHNDVLKLIDLKIQPAMEAFPMLLSTIQLNNGIHATIFLSAAASFWFGCSNVARELVSERPIFLRERRSGLRLFSYLLSIFAYQFILASAQTFLMSLIVWFSIGCTSNILLGWGLLLLTSLTGISLGLFVSASSRTEVTAISLIPLLLFPQLLFGGYVKLYGALEGWRQYITAMMPIRWSFESMMIAEYNSLQAQNDVVLPLYKVIGFESTSIMMPVGILCAFLAATFCLCLLRLNLYKQ